MWIQKHQRFLLLFFFTCLVIGSVASLSHTLEIIGCQGRLPRARVSFVLSLKKLGQGHKSKLGRACLSVDTRVGAYTPSHQKSLLALMLCRRSSNAVLPGFVDSVMNRAAVLVGIATIDGAVGLLFPEKSTRKNERVLVCPFLWIQSHESIRIQNNLLLLTGAVLIVAGLIL